MKPGDYIEDKKLLIIRRLTLKDLREKYETEGILTVPHIERALELFHIQEQTFNGCWEALDEEGELQIIWGERKK